MDADTYRTQALRRSKDPALIDKLISYHQRRTCVPFAWYQQAPRKFIGSIVLASQWSEFLFRSKESSAMDASFGSDDHDHSTRIAWSLVDNNISIVLMIIISCGGSRWCSWWPSHRRVLSHPCGRSQRRAFRDRPWRAHSCAQNDPCSVDVPPPAPSDMHNAQSS